MGLYAALLYEAEGTVEPTPAEWEQVMADHDAFSTTNESSIRGGQALHETSMATTLSMPGGKGTDLVVTDGPFAETAEVLGGFYLLEANDLEEAIKVAAQIPSTWSGKVEVRPCIDFSEGEG